MEKLPLFVVVSFMLTTAVTLFFLYKAAHYNKKILLVSIVWLCMQAALGLSKFYTVTGGNPPRFALLLLPPLLCITLVFITKTGRRFIDGLSPKTLTLLHTVRLPVELTLLWLAAHKYVPQLMTFEGRNFDVLSGLSAPFIFYFGYVRKTLGKGFLLGWNLLCSALLLNIVVNAVLSAPLPFQRFAFDQPNIALLYFPFVWLPSFIVPAVLLSHLACLRQLVMSKQQAYSLTKGTA